MKVSQGKAPTLTSTLTSEQVMVQILLGVPTERLRMLAPDAREGLQVLAAGLREVVACFYGGGPLQRRYKLPSGHQLRVDEETWRLCEALLAREVKPCTPSCTSEVVRPPQGAPPAPPRQKVHTLPEADTPAGCIERARLAERAAMRALGYDEASLIAYAKREGLPATSVRGRIVVALNRLAPTNAEARRHLAQAHAGYWRAALHPYSQNIIRPRALRLATHRDDALSEFNEAAVGAAQRFKVGSDTWGACLRWWLKSRAFKLRVRRFGPAAGSALVQLADKVAKQLRLARRLNIDLGAAELAEVLGVSVEQVREAQGLSIPVSLDTPVSEDGRSIAETLGDEEQTQHLTEKKERELRIGRLWAAVLLLPMAEAWVVARREGLGGHPVPRWDVLRRELGVSLPRVQELHRRGQERLAAQGLPDAPDNSPHRAALEALLEATAQGKGMASIIEPGEDPTIRRAILSTARRTS